MAGEETMSGISLASLREAFAGSEDVLVQMLGLFQVQAPERVQQLGTHLAAWDVMAARTALHSLVNISGAVRAYGMSDLSKAVGDAVKQDDQAQALVLAGLLDREAARVLDQVKALLEAGQVRPQDMWNAALPGHASFSAGS